MPEPNQIQWSESDWQQLLDAISDGKVIPLVGEELYTATNGSGVERPLYQVVAEQLAKDLNLPVNTLGNAITLNDVFCTYQDWERRRGRGPDLGYIYRRFAKVTERIKSQPSTTLKQLAAITDFRLFLTTSPDHLLEEAIDSQRFGGKNGTRTLGFTL
jgi:hypothetical protein